MNSKLSVLHAAVLETARRCHPRFGHKLDPETWMKVFTDADFQGECNAVIATEKKTGLFAKSAVEVPTPDDYRELGQRHADALGRWEQWGSVRALFHTLDAEAALAGIAEGPFLTELVADIVLDDMADQANRGYLKL